ncbi:hypothetical protein [Mangrovicoccus algicola]|uniref:Uncharacterized protein n=1 Tax=Mangrovicoccus algicola TaxID=2771008 RepID=A0A8J7CW80_9RHOB|nr:hypothetical protein [Mangrovicoccus algicola]MBE3637452.1 hypothetical protein [Mangrovicoccus algicola]
MRIKRIEMSRSGSSEESPDGGRLGVIMFDEFDQIVGTVTVEVDGHAVAHAISNMQITLRCELAAEGEPESFAEIAGAGSDRKRRSN